MLFSCVLHASMQAYLLYYISKYFGTPLHARDFATKSFQDDLPFAEKTP